MVQYIPNEPGTYAYPNAGKGDLNYQLMGQFGNFLGGSDEAKGFLSVAQAVQSMKQNQQQQSFMDMPISDLMQKMQPQPMQGPMQPQDTPSGPPIAAKNGSGPQGYVPPGGGPNSRMVPIGQQPMTQQTPPRPMVPGSSQLTMRDMATMQRFSPFLAKAVSQALFPPMQKQINKLPPEVFYFNPKTSEVSLSPKDGFVPQMGPAGSGVKAITQYHYRKVLEGDKDARLHLAKTIQGQRIADQVNKQMEPLDNAIQTYGSLVKARQKMTPSSAGHLQDIIKNPNPNFVVSMLRTKDPVATDYYNNLLASKNALKGIAVNKISGGKELNDLASLLPDGSEDAAGLKNKMMNFQRASDIIRARMIAKARTEADFDTDPSTQVNNLMGLPSIGSLESEEGNDYSDVDKELGQ